MITVMASSPRCSLRLRLLRELLTSSLSETPQLRKSPRALSRCLVSEGQSEGTSVLGKRARAGDHATDSTPSRSALTLIPLLREPSKRSEILWTSLAIVTGSRIHWSSLLPSWYIVSVALVKWHVSGWLWEVQGIIAFKFVYLFGGVGGEYVIIWGVVQPCVCAHAQVRVHACVRVHRYLIYGVCGCMCVHTHIRMPVFNISIVFRFFWKPLMKVLCTQLMFSPCVKGSQTKWNFIQA